MSTPTHWPRKPCDRKSIAICLTLAAGTLPATARAGASDGEVPSSSWPPLASGQAESAPDVADGIADFAELDLAALLRSDIRGGESGSYAERLAEQGLALELHAYLSLELKGDLPDGRSTFDLHHATAMLRGDLFGRLKPELALEWEHAGTEFYIPFAFFDTLIADWLVLRAGYFPAPIGAFNEYLYPDYLRVTAGVPGFTRAVVPAIWSEVGVQARGKHALAPALALNYALFVSNGLEQGASAAGPGPFDDNLDIRDMRRNTRDLSHQNKAVGGRLGVTALEALDLGLSAYTGAYTPDGRRRLSLYDLDLAWQSADLTVRAEYALAVQEAPGGTLRKHGGYALAAYRLADHWRPHLQVDLLSLAGERTWQGLAGVGFYPFPAQARYNVLKLEGGLRHDERSGRTTGLLIIQAVLGI